ncbi:MAG: hypothetical protein GC201_15080 [Alphaproteobacteria bacterium]|nr:hypothetical protein [Alphaproteobacteria bacterium]
MQKVKLDLTKLFGFKIVANEDAKLGRETTVGAKIGEKAGSKVGGKVGTKPGFKLNRTLTR